MILVIAFLSVIVFLVLGTQMSSILCEKDRINF